jgi:hypothetical protein
MIWTQGQNAGAPSPSQQRPQKVRAPRVVAAAASSSARRVFPIPGSPASSTTRPRPARPASRSASRAASSPLRPTNGAAIRGLKSRPQYGLRQEWFASGRGAVHRQPEPPSSSCSSIGPEGGDRTVTYSLALAEAFRYIRGVAGEGGLAGRRHRGGRRPGACPAPSRPPSSGSGGGERGGELEGGVGAGDGLRTRYLKTEGSYSVARDRPRHRHF